MMITFNAEPAKINNQEKSRCTMRTNIMRFLNSGAYSNLNKKENLRAVSTAEIKIISTDLSFSNS